MKVAGCTLRVGRPLHVARGTTMCRKERTGVCARTGDLARPLKQHKRCDVVLSDRIISRHNHWAATQGARKEEVLIQFLTHQRLQSPLKGLRPRARRRGRSSFTAARTSDCNRPWRASDRAPASPGFALPSRGLMDFEEIIRSRSRRRASHSFSHFELQVAQTPPSPRVATPGLTLHGVGAHPQWKFRKTEARTRVDLARRWLPRL